MAVRTFYYVFLASVALLSASCGGDSKDKYLRDYEHFILDVRQEWRTYSDKDWEKASKKNEKFFKDRRRHHAASLTAAEYVRIHRFNFAFHFYKGDISLKALLRGDYNEMFVDGLEGALKLAGELRHFFDEERREDALTVVDRLLGF